MKTPWKDRATFLAIHAQVGEWQAMAHYFASQGTPVTEATIRRWAKKHGVHSMKNAPLVVAKAEDIKAIKQQASDAIKEAERARKEAEKLAIVAQRDADRRVAEAEARPRIATPKELVEIEKEREKLRAKVSKYRTVATQLAREGNLLDEVNELILPYVQQLKVIPPIKRPKKVDGYSDSAMSLMLSLNDIHWGEVLDPKLVNNLNAYSPNIAARRLEYVVDTTRVWGQNYRNVGEVDELVILLNGDNFSGMHQIHPDEANEYARIAKQAVDCALVTAQAIAELAHDFPYIRVIAPAGDNHTRSTRRSPTSAAALETSWSSMYHEIIASLLSHVDHVEFDIAPSYQVFFDVKGYTWAACHGHNLKGGGGNLGIPAYALKRLHESSVNKTVTLAQNVDWENIDSVEKAMETLTGIVNHTILGHFHQQFYAQFNGGDVRIAPSLKGADTFSLDVLAKYNPAAQSLFAIHPEHDVIGDHTIVCQHITTEGDTRYRWGALEGGDTAAQIMKDWLNG